MKILVLGGTRYFGKRLVDLLVDDGHRVTLASRGNALARKDLPHLRIDREDPSTLSVLSGTTWDIVFDQICYDGKAAEALINVLEERVGRYVLTSTGSVYEPKAATKESDFNHRDFAVANENAHEYTKGKRLAEYTYFTNSMRPVVAVRIPIVLGPDDYTRRLHFHVERVASGSPIHFPNLNARMTFISSSDAARFLKWCGEGDLTGPINGCSDEPLSISGILRYIESVVRRKVVLADSPKTEFNSPFGLTSDWYMSNQRAVEAGFRFEKITEWFPDLVREIVSGTK